MYLRAEVHKDANRRLNFLSTEDKIVPGRPGRPDAPALQVDPPGRG